MGTPCLFASCRNVFSMFLSFNSTYLNENIYCNKEVYITACLVSILAPHDPLNCTLGKASLLLKCPVTHQEE